MVWLGIKKLNAETNVSNTGVDLDGCSKGSVEASARPEIFCFHGKLEFVFLQKHRCLPPFWCHIVLYIQRTFILTKEIPREITQKL